MYIQNNTVPIDLFQLIEKSWKVRVFCALVASDPLGFTPFVVSLGMTIAVKRFTISTECINR